MFPFYQVGAVAKENKTIVTCSVYKLLLWIIAQYSTVSNLLKNLHMVFRHIHKNVRIVINSQSCKISKFNIKMLCDWIEKE